MVDVGSGGGFPGIPLSVIERNWKVTLIESNSRRAVFLTQAIRHLGLSNISVFCGRFQDYPEHGFDVIVCRALDSFERRIKALFEFGESCSQFMLFVGTEFATRIGNSIPIGWKAKRYQIPLSKSRYLVHVSPECAT
jgi:16S rRNA (guanine527-N7)-methyltransferase